MKRMRVPWRARRGVCGRRERGMRAMVALGVGRGEELVVSRGLDSGGGDDMVDRGRWAVGGWVGERLRLRRKEESCQFEGMFKREWFHVSCRVTATLEQSLQPRILWEM